MFTKADIEKYFLAEKQGSLFFLIIGIIAILLAIGFYLFLKNNFYKGAAVPLLAIGIVQAIVGFTVYARSDRQRIDNVYAFDMNPGKLKSEELPRMQTVNKNLIAYQWAEIGFFIVGAVLILCFAGNKEKSFWLGLGIALAIQAAVMLSTDYFAGRRAKSYTKQLESFRIAR
ncbi:MAG: hypothetical protein JST47_11410 [Bacteroidetes bacterium]|nr:hypothetical protein [Bacteroidota bacterium]MBS1973072.1 hypothetical protein [Bacteroidota bacterium]